MDIEAQLSALVDAPEFQQIDRYLRKFNLFESIGAVRGELRHSNFLAFILSPGRPHGLGSELLVTVLRAVLEKIPTDRRPIRALELIVADLDSTIIHRERDNIDLLVVIKQPPLVVAIENKIGASVSDGQLGRYKNIVRQRFQQHSSVFVLLTPQGMESEDSDYVAFSYSELADIIDELIRDRRESLSDEMALILRHYVDMLRRNIVEDGQLAELAKRLYEKHKEAFDFVSRYQPEPKGLISQVRKLVVSNATLVEDSQTPTLARFAPVDWTIVPELNTCPPTEWSRTGRSVLFEIKASEDGRITLFLILGPSKDPGMRERAYDRATKEKDVFVGLVKPMGKKWSTICSIGLLTAAEAKAMSREEQIEAIDVAWLNFVNRDLPTLTRKVIELF